MNRIEEGLQVAACNYLAYVEKLYNFCWTSLEPGIPVGGIKGQLMQKRAKKRGIKAGWPDLMILGVNKVFFIELKRDAALKSQRGKLTGKQFDVHQDLQNKGYKVYIAYNLDEVVKIIEEEFKQ
jgi:hypothetical protein